MLFIRVEDKEETKRNVNFVCFKLNGNCIKMNAFRDFGANSKIFPNNPESTVKRRCVHTLPKDV